MDTFLRIVIAALIGASVSIILLTIYNMLKKRRVLKAIPSEARIEILKKYKDYDKVLKRLMDIKHTKKVQLAAYIKQEEGIIIDPDSFFDIQIKRLHEYKRQLLNALYILDLYYRVKENPSLDMPKTTFIFGAKAFPGYRRAKGIIKFINEIARLIDSDEEASKKMKVVFVQN